MANFSKIVLYKATFWLFYEELSSDIIILTFFAKW